MRAASSSVTPIRWPSPASASRSFFGPGHNDRDIDDHVFATYEFPGKNYAKDKHDVVVVTYSSISTNGFENYGECVMGDRGTLIVEKEAIGDAVSGKRTGQGEDAAARHGSGRQRRRQGQAGVGVRLDVGRPVRRR